MSITYYAGITTKVNYDASFTTLPGASGKRDNKDFRRSYAFRNLVEINMTHYHINTQTIGFINMVNDCFYAGKTVEETIIAMLEVAELV